MSLMSTCFPMFIIPAFVFLASHAMGQEQPPGPHQSPMPVYRSSEPVVHVIGLSVVGSESVTPEALEARFRSILEDKEDIQQVIPIHLAQGDALLVMARKRIEMPVPFLTPQAPAAPGLIVPGHAAPTPAPSTMPSK